MGWDHVLHVPSRERRVLLSAATRLRIEETLTDVASFARNRISPPDPFDREMQHHRTWAALDLNLWGRTIPAPMGSSSRTTPKWPTLRRWASFGRWSFCTLARSMHLHLYWVSDLNRILCWKGPGGEGADAAKVSSPCFLTLVARIPIMNLFQCWSFNSWV